MKQFMKTMANTAVALACILIAGCAPRTDTLVLQKFPPKPANAEIKIFQLKLPQCDFQEIGSVGSTTEGVYFPMSVIVESMRAEARKMGGDAIVNMQTQTVTGATSALYGTVIKFTDPDCAQ